MWRTVSPDGGDLIFISAVEATVSRPPRVVRKPRYMLELFSGTGRLTQAFAEQNKAQVLPDFEVAKGSMFDLLCPTTQQLILKLVRSGRVWYVHLGTPCTVWSRAPHNLRNLRRARQKEATGFALALFLARVIRYCLASNVRFTLDNPQSSRLWEFAPMLDILRDKRVNFFTTHMCAWGMPYKKPTSIMTDIVELSSLQKHCMTMSMYICTAMRQS